MAKSNKLPETVNGRFAAVPWAVMDSQAFIGATDRAKSLLYAFLRQLNGSNNGRLQMTDKWLREHGWTSAGLNKKAWLELLERDLIIQTKCGGLNIGCNWFAVTWLPISNFVGLDVSAQTYHKGAWAGCKLPATPKRKPPQRATLPDHRSSATPTTGAVDCLVTPTTGAKTALLGASTTPTTGNNVSIPLHPSKTTKGKKRIVGKAGRSGLAKEFRKPDVVTAAVSTTTSASPITSDSEYIRESDSELRLGYWDNDTGEWIATPIKQKTSSPELERMRGAVQALQQG